jgi:hypothetical protein
MKHQPMLLPFYEGVAGAPAQRVVALSLEGATLAPVIAGMNR